MQEESKESNVKNERKFRSIFKWIGIGAIVLVVLLIISFILVQFSPIQTWLVKRFTNSLSEDLNTEVAIESVNLNILHGIELNNILVRDLDRDSLFFAAKVHSTLDRNLLSLFKNNLHLDDLYINRAQFNLRKKHGRQINNLEAWLENYENNRSSNKKDSEGNDFRLSLQTIHVEDFLFSSIDESSYNDLFLLFQNASIQINEIDIECQHFDLDRVELRNPQVYVHNYKPEETPPTGKRIQDPSIAASDRKKRETDFMLLIRNLEWVDGTIAVQDETKNIRPSSEFDASNFYLSDFDLDIQKLNFYGPQDWNLKLNDLSFESGQGFRLNRLKSDIIVLNDRKIQLEGVEAKTDRSTIKNNFEIKYRSFKDLEDFTDRVFLKTDFKRTTVALEDIIFFFPDLKNNSFFRDNIKERVQLDGRFFGRVNNLSGRDIELFIGPKVYFSGTFDSRNLTIRDEELFNLRINKFSANVNDLNELVPGFDPPPNFYKLGNVEFDGNFDGYFLDFVAFGNMNSDIGAAKLNMRLDLKEGAESANYSGKLDLIDFDMGAWSDQTDLGKITMNASVEDGRGLTLDKASATLQGSIDSFDFKNYTYNNVNLEGSIDKSRFNGNLSVKDEFVDFNFTGIIESLDSLPSYDFAAEINKIDFNAINLSSKPFQFSGKVKLDMVGKSLQTMVGEGVASNLVFAQNDTTYVLDSVRLSSAKLDGNKMAFGLYSDIGDFDVDGIFDLREIPKVIRKIIYQNYPSQLEKLGFPAKQTLVSDHDFKFRFKVYDSKNFLDLVGAKKLYISNTTIYGNVNSITDEFDVELSSPFLRFDKYSFVELVAKFTSQKDKGSVDIRIDSSQLDGKLINPITLYTNVEQDTLAFKLTTTELIDSVRQLNISGAILPDGEGYTLKLFNDEWNMFGSNWRINPQNDIYFDREELDIRELSISDGKRTIFIDDIKNRGLKLELRNFDFELMNMIIDYDKMWFAGVGNLEFIINDAFKREQWRAHMQIPNFTINEDPYGSVDIHAQTNEQNEIVYGISIHDGDQYFNVDGAFDTNNATTNGKIEVNDYPMKIFEYIIDDGITETVGVADINATYSGKISNLDLNGEALISGGGTKIIYLGTFYTFDQQRLTISENYIDATGIKLTDTNGNEALMSGGLKHDLFADFRLDINISSPNFIAINTTKEDNPVYYGFGQGEIIVDFSGPFDSADIRVNAKTKEGTEIFFPVRTYTEEIDQSFITFINKEEQELSFEEEFKLLGLDFEMNLEITTDAEVSIIFDERYNEILKGKGNGNVQTYIKRTGEFDVFGNYEIESGEYLFTAYGLVAKPFILERGGQLTWTGDPFNAQLNVKADYKGLRAPLNVFLSEYLAQASPQVQQEARKRTEIDLILDLKGTLYSPIINFDIGFPEAQGELKSYTDSKIRTLKGTENGINNQVVGLFVFRNFLPSNNPLGNLSTDNLIQSGYNTISEFFFSQISLMFTSLFEEALVEKGILSSVDFEIGLSKNTEFSQNSEATFDPDEVEITLKNRFIDDRIALNLGGNFVRESPFENVGSYLLGDIVFEWFITQDRKVKLKMYGKYDYDGIESQRKQKYGVGISYRKEFGNLIDLKKSVKEALDESVGSTPSEPSKD